MKYSVYDKISQEDLQSLVDVANAENIKTFREELEKRYKFEIFERLGITKEDCILIGLCSKKTINKVYFDNVQYFTNVARYYARKYSVGAKIFCAEDILQQIYVDLRYYDFSSEKAFKDCLRATARTVNFGGIVNSGYYKEQNVSCSLYTSVSAHNSKMESETELISFIPAPEESNPETMYIERESRQESADYRANMLNILAEKLPLKKRKKFFDAFGGKYD